jgi:hypothetical protein
MNKIHCSTLKEPDLWMNTVYFEKRKKKSPYLPTHRWNEGSGAGNKHIFKGGLIIFNFIMYFLCFMFNSKSLYLCPLFVFYWIINNLISVKKKKKFHPIYRAAQMENAKSMSYQGFSRSERPFFFKFTSSWAMCILRLRSIVMTKLKNKRLQI